jgi:hypothetical protein
MTFTFNDAGFKAEFGRKIDAARNPRRLLLAAGRTVGNELKKHFLARDHNEPNKLSERRSHFWEAVARTVQQPQMEDANTISVSVNHPAFAQKVFGGRIKAKLAGALTIPVEERAYGRTTHTFEAETGLKLFLLRTGKSKFQNAVLAVKDTNAKGFTVEYVLAKSVDQKADPDALPPKSALEAAILAASQRALDLQLADKASES